MRIPALTLVLLLVTRSSFAEELTLDNVTAPAENSVDEPLAAAFSLDNATRFLDQASLDWTKSRKCFTCHTNYSYLIARPTVSAAGSAHRQIREALEELVEQRWETNGPRWDAEVVMSAAVLAMNDAATSGKLHATTRKALDRMWTLQREDGGFDWLKCGWPPMESDDDYGIAIAALAAGAAPDDYGSSEAARGAAKTARLLESQSASNASSYSHADVGGSLWYRATDPFAERDSHREAVGLAAAGRRLVARDAGKLETQRWKRTSNGRE